MRTLSPVLAVVFFSFGCGVSAHAGKPLALGTSADGSIMWMARPVVTPSATDRSESTTAWGIFACYRSTTPAPPQCYMAQYTWRPEDLHWPMGEGGEPKK